MRPGSNPDRAGAALITGCFLVLGLIGAAVGLIENRREHPASAGATIVLLDRTDRLSPSQVQDVVEALRHAEDDELHPGDQVQVFALGGGGFDGLERVFAGQFPGRHVSELVGNQEQVAERCDSTFTVPLRTVITAALQAHESSHSALLQAVRELGDQPDLRNAKLRRNLIVVSNFMQNEPEMSFYKTSPDNPSLLRSALRVAMADLRGVRVNALYLPAGPNGLGQEAGLRKLWAAYFTACGAVGVRFARL